MTEATPFPGWTAAFPVLGAALVLWAGSYGDEGVVYRTLSLGPAQFVGNISYSLYLWHWPVLVLGGIQLGGNPTTAELIGLVVFAVLLAIASYFLVERRLGGLFDSARSHRVIAVGLVVTLVACLTPLATSAFVPQSSGATVAQAGSPDLKLSSIGSPVTFQVPGPGFMPEAVPANLETPLDDLTDDLAEVFTNGCFAAQVAVCEGGDPEGKRKIVLVGDSHAGQWWPAIDKAARENQWKLYIVGKNGCPLADVGISKGSSDEAWPECDTWQEEAVSSVLALDADLVVYANNAEGYRRGKASLEDNFIEQWSTGASATLKELSTGSPALFIGQSPTLIVDPATCLSENLFDVPACSTPAKDAVPQDLRALNASIAMENGAVYFDPMQILCSTSDCPMIANDMVMYRDSSHLSASYSAQLSSKLAVVIGAALADRG